MASNPYPISRSEQRPNIRHDNSTPTDMSDFEACSKFDVKKVELTLKMSKVLT